MKAIIQDIATAQIQGVQVALEQQIIPYNENFFCWKEAVLTADFHTNQVSCGMLKAWHHQPIFSEVETHVDSEMFYFISGTALMLFADVKNGTPDMKSVQIVRILAGTQLIIAPGKAHFVAVAQDDEPIQAMVIAPKMAAPRIPLPEVVEGILENH